MSFNRLIYNDRLKIECMRKLGYKPKEIAEEIGFCLATVYNELKRGKIEVFKNGKKEILYSALASENQHYNRMKKCGKKSQVLDDEKLQEYLSHMLIDKKYSPQAIIDDINNRHLKFDFQVKSKTTIYNAIKKGYIRGVTLEHLPVRKKERKKKIVRQKRLIKGELIDKRPLEYTDRNYFGSWEMDTVKGKKEKGPVILNLVERKTRYSFMMYLKDNSIYEVVKALNRIEKLFGSPTYGVFKCVTTDNGSEFLDYVSTSKALYRKGKRFDYFYCNPYSSFERGSNENCNKFIRRWLPKGTDFNKELTRKKLKFIQNWTNNYPRQIFGGKSARDMFRKELIDLGFP